MNSYFSVFHLEFPYQSFGFAEPGPLAEVERWFLVDVVSPVGGNPVPEGSLVNAEFSSDLGDRPRVHDDRFHGFVLELRGELSSIPRHVPSLSRWMILVDHQSKKLGAPQATREEA
jgi:hypothetical protein